MDLRPHLSPARSCARKAPVATPVGKKLDPSRLHEGRQLQCGAFEGAANLGISGVAFNKYVMNALTRKGSKPEEMVLLLDLFGVRGWLQSRHEPTLIDMLKDQVQELGSRDVNLDASID